MKARMMAAVAALMGLFVAQPVSAMTWGLVSVVAQPRYMTFMALDRMSRVGDRVTVWLKDVYQKPQATGRKYTMTKAVVNCSKSTFFLANVAYYTADGKYINGQTLSVPYGDSGFQDAIPGTLGDRLIAAACQGEFVSDKLVPEAFVQNMVDSSSW